MDFILLSICHIGIKISSETDSFWVDSSVWGRGVRGGALFWYEGDNAMICLIKRGWEIEGEEKQNLPLVAIGEIKVAATRLHLAFSFEVTLKIRVKFTISSRLKFSWEKVSSVEILNYLWPFRNWHLELNLHLQKRKEPTDDWSQEELTDTWDCFVREPVEDE